MAKQTFTTGQVLTATQMNSLQANDYNWTVDTKTDSYVLVAGDAGKRIVMNAATAKTITVNTSVFTAGDTVWIHNINTGTCTVTAGTATVNTAGSLALAQWEGGALYFTSASTAIFFRGGGANYGVATGGSSSSITVSGQNYTLLTFTSTGTLTVTKAGLFDVYCVASGAGGAGANFSTHRGGGGGGGGHQQNTIYLSSNITITVGAGGAGGHAGGSKGSNGNFSHAGNNFCIAQGGGYGANRADAGASLITGGGGGNNGGAGGVATAFGGSALVGYNGAAGPGGDNASGGGGGMGGAASGATAGVGLAVTFQGSSVTLSAGGAGQSGTGNGTSGGANTANGGGGAGGATATGGNGGSGIVYVRFKV